ncbi:hypothetical protein [Flavobacterium noncentrifugens]|uniref:Uncharacterized protein n=1 Tax=Flavobacterium noncentrifugens TaxID=1128970 RepID=A0A1G9DCE2_9FLAO|nr:hypothetical protein [Flavobacterium noncentrifugens]SDK61515.1 hypothetical protein SAMN04487935_3776 [Flavobacterium noncentrifugens]
MENLKSPYSAVIVERQFIENAKQATLYIPMKNGEQFKIQIEDISRHVFIDKSNSLAIIRLGELANRTGTEIIYENVVLVPQDLLSDFSTLNKIEVNNLKESWKESMNIK